MKPKAGVSRTELTLMCYQFSTLMSAGVDALRAIEVLKQQTENPRLIDILDSIHRDLSMGRSLAHAFSRFPHYFSPLFVSMVRQGEREGILGEIMLKLAEHLERESSAFGVGLPISEMRVDWDALVGKIRPLVAWLSIVVSVIAVGMAVLWYITLAGFLPAAYLGPNIALLIGLAMLIFALLFLRYRPPKLARCNFCGRPEDLAGALIPGEGVFICTDCIQRSVQVLREHRLAVADAELETVAVAGEEEQPEEFDKRDWQVRGQITYLSDDDTPEEERIKLLPKPEEET